MWNFSKTWCTKTIKFNGPICKKRKTFLQNQIELIKNQSTLNLKKWKFAKKNKSTKINIKIIFYSIVNVKT